MAARLRRFIPGGHLVQNVPGHTRDHLRPSDHRAVPIFSSWVFLVVEFISIYRVLSLQLDWD